MDIKALMKKHGITAGVAGGCLVIGSQFGTCTVAPTPPAPVAEEAPAPEAEEPKEEKPVEEAPAEEE
jgi:hypothetical protein